MAGRERPSSSSRRRWLSLTGAAVFAAGLAACAGLPFGNDYTFSEAQLQRALDRKFPFDRHVLAVLDVNLSHPRLTLLPERNRLAVAVDATIAQFQRIANGDLTGQIVVASNNEMGRLAAALRKMQESLIATVNSVRQGTESIDTGVSETPITPVIVGQASAAQAFNRRLFEEGIYATAVVYPTVALDKARLRTIVSSEHTTEELQIALDAFGRIGRELRII